MQRPLGLDVADHVQRGAPSRARDTSPDATVPDVGDDASQAPPTGRPDVSDPTPEPTKVQPAGIPAVPPADADRPDPEIEGDATSPAKGDESTDHQGRPSEGDPTDAAKPEESADQ